jgi:hypothetical protein
MATDSCITQPGIGRAGHSARSARRIKRDRHPCRFSGKVARFPEGRLRMVTAAGRDGRARSAVRRGNLVSQTAGSRRAELDVLRPVTPAAQRPCQRFGSAGERAHSPRRAWLSLHRAISGCGDPVSHEDRASRPAQEALPRVPGSGRRADPRCQTAAKASPALALRAAFDQAQPGRHRRP